jgi:hypothetical protein
MDNPAPHPDFRAASAAEADLKTRIFAAFEHACRFGEVEVADQLLAIINSKWVKQARGQQTGTAGAQRTGSAGRFTGPLS